MSTDDDATAIRELLAAGTNLAAPRIFESMGDVPAGMAAILPPGHSLEVMNLRGYFEVDLPAPARITGTVNVSDVPSWLAYWGKHCEATPEVYADRILGSVTGVLNASGPSDPQWGDHRVVLTLQRSPEWLDWRRLNGQMAGQQQFAEFIEDHLAEITEPDAATMLELAQSFEASLGGRFKSATRLANGERRIILEEQIDARAGKDNQLDIPSHIEIAVRPFKAGSPVSISARFRYRIVQGALQLGYVLDRPDDREEEAFLALTGSIAEQVAPVTVLQGTPA